MQIMLLHKTAIATCISILGLVFLSCELLSAQVREWTDNTGKFKFKAELVRVSNDVVILKSQATGKEQNVPLNRLSDSDQAWVKDYLASIKSTPNANTETPKETNSAKSELPFQPPGPRFVKREPEKVELDDSHFSGTDTPPKPKFVQSEVAAAEPEEPKSSPSPAEETKFANTKNATVIPEIGDVDLAELAKLPTPFSTLATTVASSQKRPDVRQALIELRELPPELANENLVNLLRKQTQVDDRECRAEALNVMARVTPETCLPFVLRAVDDQSFEVKWLAFKLLKELRDVGCIEPLAMKFASPDRSQIVSILETFGSQVETHLHKMVTHSKSEVRLDAVRLLGRIGTSASLDVLKKALDDKNGIVRLQARSAIKKIKQREENNQ